MLGDVENEEVESLTLTTQLLGDDKGGGVMDIYSQPVRRVFGFQFAVFMVITVVLLQVTSPGESFGGERHKREKGQQVMLLPPPPFDLGLLLAGARIKVEYRDQRQVRHEDNRGTGVHKLRYIILQAAEAVERGNLRKASRILARAQRGVRQVELGSGQYKRNSRGHHREKEYVYYGYNGRDECNF